MRWLRALRLEDVLALLFSGALLALSTLFTIQFDFTVVRGVLFLFAYYAVLYAFGRWLARTPRLDSVQRRTFQAWVLFLLCTLILIIPGKELMLLEKPKYLMIAIMPLILAWWLNPGAGQPTVETERYTGFEILRDLGPVIISQVCYLLLHDVIHHINPIDRDQWLLQADVWLFGGHVTHWLEPLVSTWATEWFSMTYSLFLFLPLTLSLWFIARAERRALRHLLQALVLCNYLGYIGYLVVPAIGPMYTLKYEVPLIGGWFFQVKESLDQLARVPRDCFPSLHTSNTLVVLLAVWQYARKLGWAYLPLGISCMGATLYLRYHYTVDVLVGFAMGLGCFLLAPRLSAGWDRLVKGRSGDVR